MSAPAAKARHSRMTTWLLACGSVVNMDLIPGLAAYAYPLKTLGDVIYLGNEGESHGR